MNFTQAFPIAYGVRTTNLEDSLPMVKQFSFGRVTVNNEKPPGMPKSVDDKKVIEDVRSMVMKDRRLTVKSIGETLKISPFCMFGALSPMICA